MRRKLFSAAVLGICIVWLTSSAMSQGTPEDSRKGEGLLDKIHDTLMGGVLTPKAKPQPSTSSARQQATGTPTQQRTSARSGSAMAQDRTQAGVRNTHRQSSTPAAYPGNTQRFTGQAASRVQRPTSSLATRPKVTSNAHNTPRSPVASNPVSPSSAPSAAVTTSQSTSRKPSRMYERMTALRNSAFAEESNPKPGEPKPSTGSPANTGSAMVVSKAPVSTQTSTATPSTAPRIVSSATRPATPSTSQAIVPTPASRTHNSANRPAATRPSYQFSRAPTASSQTSATASSTPTAASGPTRSTANTPIVAPTVASRPREVQAQSKPAKPVSSFAGTQPPARQPAAPAKPPVASRSADGVLFARQSPVLSVETIGPRRIIVGKESAFEITVSNTGRVAADQTIVNIDLPVWTDILGAEVSRGSTSSASSVDGTKEFLWKVGKLTALDEEKLILRIVSHESRPFDLAVNWDYTPTSSQTMIEVQEPKLHMQLDGPSEVLFGEKEVYRLELSNVGTGEATDVKILLQPVGAGENVAASHTIDVLKAGEKKAIEVELTARQAGSLTIKVDAIGDGVEAHVVENVVVLKPELTLSVEAPEFRFVGTQATYRISAFNPGTAAAKNVVVTAKLPTGAKYVSCEQGGLAGPGERSVTWTYDNLKPKGETFFLLTCNLESTGQSRLEVQSKADRELVASSDAMVRVEAMADLALKINDPAGPVQTGDDAFFEVEVRNRGTKTAENVEIAAYFSEGIEPLAVEGGQHRIGPGQVIFDNIDALAAGEVATFKIKARADMSGNHVFRVEVNCKPLGARLVNEEMTHFYGKSLLSQNDAPTAQPKASPLRSDGVRTATRPRPPAPPQAVEGDPTPVQR